MLARIMGPKPHVVPVVLLADDSAVARLAVARRLRAEGFEVFEHASAAPLPESALARVACCLLDLDLGDADGSDFAHSLRARRAELPVAFFSSTGACDVLARARALGPVFVKPSELDAAVAWVRNKVGSSSR